MMPFSENSFFEKVLAEGNDRQTPWYLVVTVRPRTVHARPTGHSPLLLDHVQREELESCFQVKDTLLYSGNPSLHSTHLLAEEFVGKLCQTGRGV